MNTVIQYGARLALIVAALSLPLLEIQQTVQAQRPGADWTDFVNISQTATASTFPCIAADAAGNIHVVWTEDVGGKTQNLTLNRNGSPELDFRGNPINTLTDAGNTLYYSRWDGKQWRDPIDIQINSLGKVQYPEAVVDPNGILHVIWAAGEGSGVRLYYSRAQASKAESAHAWSTPAVLAEPLLDAYYPTDIAADSTGGIHVIYSQVGAEPGAYVINSFDGGNTWSAPTQLYQTAGGQEGISTVRLVADGKDRLHATWTRFDAAGNGKGIYYSQSGDLGQTWSRRIEVAAWQPGWYEVDWLTVGVVEDEIHLVWEGSAEVANLNERISHDGGRTWGESRHIFPNLVGENGFANLVTDSGNQLHLLVVLRGLMASDIHGIWYSQWENDHWQDPVLLGTNISGMYDFAGTVGDSQKQRDLMRSSFATGGVRYQQSALVNGNGLFVIVPNEWDGEIWSSHTTVSAPLIASRPYAQPTATPTLTPTVSAQALYTPTPAPRYQVDQTLAKSRGNAGNAILIGILPTLLIIAAVVAIVQIINRR